MLERSHIQTRGFRNVADKTGTVTGFQFDLRMPNYRGIAGSLIDGVEVSVDGRSWDADTPLWTLQGRTFTIDELRKSTDARWQLDELATITVPEPGGLAPGVHDIDVSIFIRRPYFPPQVQRSRFPASAKGTIVGPPNPTSNFRLGVSLYSYSGDMYTSMTLEDAMADIADLGATGIEILSEGNIPGYPAPSLQWIDTWHGLLDKYGLTATNYGSWIDTVMWRDRDLTAQEAAEQLQLDLRLASRLGFTSVRPKFGITSAELDPHPVWEEAVERSLELATELGIVICPEIHSPTPIKNHVTQGYIDFIERTGTEQFKLLIDTGIFQTAPVDDGHEGMEKGKRPPFLEPLAVPMSDLAEVIRSRPLHPSQVLRDRRQPE